MTTRSRRVTPVGTRRAPAFTLAELVVSAAVMSILVVGLASAMVLASRALPVNRAALDGTLTAANALEQFSGELLLATSFPQRGTNLLAFTVPDRTGDGLADTISYSWSRTVGDPVCRQLNGGELEPMIRDVREFTLSFVAGYTTRTGDPTRVDSAEATLAYHDSNSNLSDRQVKSDQWVAQVLRPSLSGDALGWRLTRVWLYLKRDGGTAGVAELEIRTSASYGPPNSTVLASQTVRESNLAENWAWYEFLFPGLPEVAPDQSLALVLRHVTDKAALKVRYHNALSLEAPRYESNDAGASWQVSLVGPVLYYVIGTTISEGPPEVIQVPHMTGVRARVSVNGVDAPLETSAPILSQPEIAP